MAPLYDVGLQVAVRASCRLYSERRLALHAAKDAWAVGNLGCWMKLRCRLTNRRQVRLARESAGRKGHWVAIILRQSQAYCLTT